MARQKIAQGNALGKMGNQAVMVVSVLASVTLSVSSPRPSLKEREQEGRLFGGLRCAWSPPFSA